MTHNYPDFGPTATFEVLKAGHFVTRGCRGHLVPEHAPAALLLRSRHAKALPRNPTPAVRHPRPLHCTHDGHVPSCGQPLHPFSTTCANPGRQARNRSGASLTMSPLFARPFQQVKLQLSPRPVHDSVDNCSRDLLKPRCNSNPTECPLNEQYVPAFLRKSAFALRRKLIIASNASACVMRSHAGRSRWMRRKVPTGAPGLRHQRSSQQRAPHRAQGCRQGSSERIEIAP